MLQINDQEITRLNIQLANAQRLPALYSQVLKASLPAISETIQLPRKGFRSHKTLGALGTPFVFP
jgi:hypothetical protein